MAHRGLLAVVITALVVSGCGAVVTSPSPGAPSRSDGPRLGLSLGVLLLDPIFPGSSAITPIAGGLPARGYSPRDEYAADAHGVALLRRIGRSKDVMIDTLSRQRTVGGSSGGFFPTPPGTVDRSDALRTMR